MKKSKKILSIILALVLVLSVGTAMLISNAEDNSKETAITVSVDKTTLLAGESATVTVKATTNYAAGTISIPVFYDKTLVTVSDATATSTEYTNATVTTDLTAVDTSKVYANTGIDSEKFGFVLVNYIAGAGTTVSEMLSDVTLLTFKITAKADVTGEAVIKCVTESAKTDSNVQGMLYFGAQPDGNVIDAIPENIEGIDVAGASTTVKIGDAVPELLLSEYGESIGAVISTTYGTMDGYDGAVYGIDTLGVYAMDTLSDCLTTPAGYININTDNSSGMETTGTVIELYDDSDNLVASYIFIYFGDVDMDGMITSVDGTICADYELTLDGIYEEYVMMAADADGDTMVTSVDGTILGDYELTLDPEASYYPTQAEIAANYQ